jgi:ubiquinone/menaquinone biosynthesis C-methylase UbiE
MECEPCIVRTDSGRTPLLSETMGDDLQSAYNKKYVAEQWEPLVLRPNAISTSRYDDVARLLEHEKGALLEIGCGGGQLVLALADRFDRLVGTDISDVRIATADRALRERYPALVNRVSFKRGRADERLPFGDRDFDVVIACAVLEHVVDVFAAIDEVARVTKPGGAVVITVPNICYGLHVKDLLLGRVPLTGSPTRDIKYWRDHGWDGGHFHYFSKATLSELLENVGFTPEAWTGDGKFAALRRWHPNLVGNLTVRARRR